MAFISDILLSAGAFGVAIYCMILSRRLRRFTSLEGDIGKAIKTMSVQISELNLSLRRAQENGNQSVRRLNAGSQRAEEAAKHLELLVASLHSLPSAEKNQQASNPFFARREQQPAGDE
ncbi:MAG: hypothetical protein ABJO29_09490 [Yoonia sp.]|uniref:hypothetical protein n=1 Tax=Yoonia sp. TaxID=2212373 RepID=UPI00327A552F